MGSKKQKTQTKPTIKTGKKSIAVCCHENGQNTLGAFREFGLF